MNECSSQHGEEPNFFQEFLGFIEKRMLHPHRSERAECREVVRFLEECLHKGNRDPSYMHW
jgi:hypothetical protein